MENTNPKYANGLHLFGAVYSNNSQRVMLLVAEKGLEAEFHEVNLLKSEQLTEEYLRLNPNGEIPALVHNGRAMQESCDIMRYLEAEFPEPSFTPQADEARQSMERWLDAAADSHKDVINYLYSHGLGRKPTPDDWAFYQKHKLRRTEFHINRRKGLIANDRVAATAALDTLFTQLESTLSTTPWLAGNSYSLADMAWVANASALTQLGYSLKKFPKVREWVARVQARPAYQSAIGSKMKIPGWLLRTLVRIINRTGNRS